MRKRVSILVLAAAAAAVVAASAWSAAAPVGPLPDGPTKTVRLAPQATFTATLPAPSVDGRVWRVARAYDASVVREVGEGDSKSGVWVKFAAVAPGSTSVVFALTRGETARAYAARTFRFVVAERAPAGAAKCPRGLLALTANPIGPAVTAALVADDPKNRPQVTGAMIASSDTRRGPQVKAMCGAKVAARTVVVYITDRALLPSQSLSERVLFVGRTSAGYRVWQRAH